MPILSTLTLVISALVLVTLQVPVHGQRTVTDSVQKAKSLFLVVDPDGWPVPNKAKDKAASTNNLTLGSTEIQVTKYVPSDRSELSINLFSIDDSGVLVQRGKSCELKSYSKLEKSGKVFAYTLDLIQFGVSETAGRMYFGAPIFIAIIDNDGDGVFESRIYSPSGALETVPEWVKRPGTRYRT